MMSDKRILIVQNSLGIARALEEALRLPQGGGYRVEIAESGEAALERLSGAAFDLMLSDTRLPGLDGAQLLQKAQQVSPGTKSVLITDFGTAQLKEVAGSLADAYIPQPFRLQKVIEVIRRTLDTTVIPERSLTPAHVDVVERKRKHSTYLTTLAFSVEEILNESGQMTAGALNALHTAETAELSLILVTDQIGSDWIAESTWPDLCEAIVAENGAWIYFPHRDVTVTPFGRLAPSILEQLERLDMPLKRGEAILITKASYDEAIIKALQETTGSATVEYKRDTVMILPPGATKGTGLRYALRELGYSPHNVVACGNAPNDRSLFEASELAVTPPNAPSALQETADAVLPQADGQGLQMLIDNLVAGHLPRYRPRPNRRLSLGHRMDRTPVHVDPLTLLTGNLGIFGGSGSGKSWLAGLLAEELLRHGYQVCIIDPEGDYRNLGAAPHTLLLEGQNHPLPLAEDINNFLQCGCISLVLDLSTYNPEKRTAYIRSLLNTLREMRDHRGRPHWFLIDEIQNLCPRGGNELTDLLLESMAEGGFGLVSYRPNEMAPALLEALDHWLLTRLRLPEAMDTLKHMLNKSAGGTMALAQLPTLPLGQAYHSFTDAKLPPGSTSGFVKFHVGPRAVPHIRHLHKYMEATLPKSKQFYFHDEQGHYLHRQAANLHELLEALNDLPFGSIQYHLGREDFSRWVRDVLRDYELAHRLQRTAQRDLTDEALRQALVDIVTTRYRELDRLR